jgi:hypothetical protein
MPHSGYSHSADEAVDKYMRSMMPVLIALSFLVVLLAEAMSADMSLQQLFEGNWTHSPRTCHIQKFQ